MTPPAVGQTLAGGSLRLRCHTLLQGGKLEGSDTWFEVVEIGIGREFLNWHGATCGGADARGRLAPTS
ncbi:MAG: hypothetical protein WBQ94_02890, partial [Terracidiphilus sp.]